MTLPYILQFSEKSPDKLQRIGQIPLFYIQILGAFNECKKTQTLDKITSSKLLQQPLWNNSLLLYKGQSLFFKTWINSGILYLKDMIGDDGKLIDIKDFSNILENKSNWQCEYGIMKYTLQPFIKKYNLSNARSTNIHNNTSFQFYTELSNIEEKNAFFFTIISL